MLAIDVGNTNVRIAAFKGDAIAGRASLSSRDLDLVELMRAIAGLSAEADESALWIASVYPEANAIIDSAAERLGFSRRFIRPSVDPIIRHRLKTPETTGADRLLSALAAGALHFPQARDGYVVVQCGSAATVDHVDAAGYFRGGYIIPGPSLWLSGLSRAAQLPDFSHEPPDWTQVETGATTRDAILGGMAVGLPFAVVSCAKVPGSEEGIHLPAVVTGGWGGAVRGLLGDDAIYDPDLLLHGIRIFAQRIAG